MQFTFWDNEHLCRPFRAPFLCFLYPGRAQRARGYFHRTSGAFCLRTKRFSPFFSRGFVARRRRRAWIQGASGASQPARREDPAGVLDSTSRNPTERNAVDMAGSAAEAEIWREMRANWGHFPVLRESANRELFLHCTVVPVEGWPSPICLFL